MGGVARRTERQPPPRSGRFKYHTLIVQWGTHRTESIKYLIHNRILGTGRYDESSLSKPSLCACERRRIDAVSAATERDESKGLLTAKT